MLKLSSTSFRNAYWLALNLPFFVGSAIITTATYGLSRLNLIINIIAILSAISTLYLDHKLFKIQTKSSAQSALSDSKIRIKKQINGQRLAILKLVLGILATLPSMFNLSILSLILFTGMTALFYFIEIGTNCRILPIYLLSLMHPCYAITTGSKSGIAYIANDDDVHNAPKHITSVSSIINSDLKSEKINVNKKYDTEAMFLIK